MRTTAPVQRLQRVFSLSGLVPLGAFLLLHLGINARALRGSAAFEGTVRAVQSLPLLGIIEALFVFAPLALHGALGAWLVVRGLTLEPSPYPRDLRLAMRISAVLVLLFLAFHLPELRFHSRGPRLGGGELATLLDAHLASTWRGIPWRGLLYLAGTASVTFHLACGVWGWFAREHPGPDNARRRRWLALGALLAGLATWAAFADVVVFRATGSALFGGAVDSVPPCP
jgi:succinate dehydrogenase / fumarate reductase cytochrome b subunit